jgi:hypothetical protein
MTPEKSSWRSVAWSVFFLFVLTIIIGIVFEIFHVQHAVETRNTFFRRGWVEHVYSAGKKKGTEKLVVIISNSQGYGREVADKATYSSLLESHLVDKLGQKVRVLNWSVAAGRAPEFVVLAAALKRLEPDVFLFISNPENFRKIWMTLDREDGSRQHWGSDCYQLIGFSDIRKNIPQSFLDHFFRPIDYFDIYLARIFQLWRYKEVVVSKLMSLENLRPFEKNSQDENWFFDSPLSKEEYTYYLNQTIENTGGKSKILKKRNISGKLMDYFFETARQLSGKKIYVSMPLHSSLSKNNTSVINEFN